MRMYQSSESSPSASAAAPAAPAAAQPGHPGTSHEPKCGQRPRASVAGEHQLSPTCRPPARQTPPGGRTRRRRGNPTARLNPVQQQGPGEWRAPRQRRRSHRTDRRGSGTRRGSGQRTPHRQSYDTIAKALGLELGRSRRPHPTGRRQPPKSPTDGVYTIRRAPRHRRPDPTRHGPGRGLHPQDPGNSPSSASNSSSRPRRLRHRAAPTSSRNSAKLGQGSSRAPPHPIPA